MKIFSSHIRSSGIRVCLAIMFLLASRTLRAADPQPVQSDGSIVVYDFEDPKTVDKWVAHGNGNFKIQGGELVFDQSDGDNAVDTPTFKTNDEYVLQTAFRITQEAKITVPFMIIGLITDDGGDVAWRTNFKVAADAKNTYMVGVQDPEAVQFDAELEKDHMYILAIHVVSGKANYFVFEDESDREGSFLGSINLDSNPSSWVRIGNVFGAGSGAQVQDNVLVGKPRPPGPEAVSHHDKLATVWSTVKSFR